MTTNHIKELSSEPHITILNYGVGGSRAYGMHTDDSDWDYNGFYLVDKKEQYVNPRHSFPSKFSFKTPLHEGTIHEMDKALDLIIDCNPNMLELLWRDPSDILVESELGNIIKDYRYDLLCSKARHTFSGYAFSQLKRIKGHNKWINKENRAVIKVRDALHKGEISEDQLNMHFSQNFISRVKQTD